jgi:hypothetical protein
VEVPVLKPIRNPFPTINTNSDPAAAVPRPVPIATGHCARRRIEQAIIDVFGLRATDLRRRGRGPARIAFARQCGMYVAHITFGQSYSDAGSMFGRDRTTAAHACSVVEDRRDNADIDAILRLIECLALGEPAPVPFRGIEA